VRSVTPREGQKVAYNRSGDLCRAEEAKVHLHVD
jgi:hypothetical protein